ncbi:MAG: DUF4870 domain-containing protein [Candidatus ainarchaeum sp.]|nr:DUF4870 domain-containing protein [Candidatus ainarchaeum sp.]
MEDAGIGATRNDSRILAAIPYVFGGMIVALLVYLLADKKDAFARFHAMQVMLFDAAMIPVTMVLYAATVLLILTVIGICFVWAAWVAFVVSMICLRVYLAASAYEGKAPMLPVVGRMAKDQVA